MKAMTNPLVTVLISTHNRPIELRYAIQSIYDQTYQNFEIRLTRDGGIPISLWDMKDDRLHIINRDENKGLAYSFNQSIDNAQGKYVCYLGDDDLFYPNHIETLVRALQDNPDYGVVYSDLYKVHYKYDAYGKRIAQAKNVEVCRDFDRMSLFRFNNMLHVATMHKAELFSKTGTYNEEITCLLDWDLNRRMCFYTDFLHIPKVTGEYYALMGGNNRISTRQRNDPPAFVRNFLNIRHTRPAKPWDKVTDLSILIPMPKYDKVINKTLRNIHLFTWYPHQVFVTCPAPDVHLIKTSHPHVSVIPFDEPREESWHRTILHHYSDGIKVEIKPGHPVGRDIIPWIEGIVNKELKGK